MYDAEYALENVIVIFIIILFLIFNFFFFFAFETSQQDELNYTYKASAILKKLNLRD